MSNSLYRSAFSADVSPCDVLAFHRGIFGPSVMQDGVGDDVDSGDQGDDAGDDSDVTDTSDTGSKDDLGDAGKKALNRERDARKAAEKKASAMEAKVTALIDGLKTGLGIKADGSDDPADLIGGLRTELEGLKHSALVDAVARRHGITDETDLTFLRSAKDQDAMDALAKRLAPTKDDDEGTKGKSTGPRPDPSQGRGSGGSGARPSSVAQVMEDRRAAREKAGK